VGEFADLHRCFSVTTPFSLQPGARSRSSGIGDTVKQSGAPPWTRQGPRAGAPIGGDPRRIMVLNHDAGIMRPCRDGVKPEKKFSRVSR
jgi:hypothetical protein